MCRCGVSLKPRRGDWRGDVCLRPQDRRRPFPAEPHPTPGDQGLPPFPAPSSPRHPRSGRQGRRRWPRRTPGSLPSSGHWRSTGPPPRGPHLGPARFQQVCVGFPKALPPHLVSPTTGRVPPARPQGTSDPRLPSARILVAPISQDPPPWFSTPNTPWLPGWKPLVRLFRSGAPPPPATGRPHPSPRPPEKSPVVFNRCHE